MDQLARLFYHAPKFVVLDEATSAVSNDVEALFYASAREAGMTLITVSHRPSLFKYHRYLLKIGEGENGTGYEFIRIGALEGDEDGEEGLKKTVDVEIRTLETYLNGAEMMAKRLKEINAELKLGSGGSSGTPAGVVDSGVRRTLF